MIAVAAGTVVGGDFDGANQEPKQKLRSHETQREAGGARWRWEKIELEFEFELVGV